MMDIHLIAALTSPMNIPTTPQGLLWMLPLVLAISIAYKAMKLPSLKLSILIKETAGLFGSIVVFMFLIAVGLLVFDWFILQQSFFSF